MYAVIETGGRQLRVQVGDVVHVASREGEVGSEVVFDRVLMVGGGQETSIGAPAVEGSVRGSIVGQGRDSKVVIYTYKRRKNSNRRRMGHRQNFTAVKIEAIDTQG